MVSVYCPTGVLGEAVNVAVAVSPSAVAGANAVRLNVPGSVGVTLVSAMSTTVPLLSEALTGTLIAVPTRPSSSEQLSAGARWVPRSATLSFANPSHCTDGSKASDPLASPASIPALRRRVLSAVLVRSVPHCVPGSNADLADHVEDGRPRGAA